MMIKCFFPEDIVVKIGKYKSKYYIFKRKYVLYIIEIRKKNFFKNFDSS